MIRSATTGDASAINDVVIDSGLFGSDDAQIVEQMMSDYFTRGIHQGHQCLVDEQDDMVVAVAYYEPAIATDGTWYLTMIAVRAAQQSHGRGAALLHHLEGDLREQGQRLLLVETSGTPGFARTRAFYTRCGYAQEAQVRDYYETGDDMIMFRKQI